MKSFAFVRLLRTCLACGAALALPTAGSGAPRPAFAHMHAVASERGRAAVDCTTKGAGAFIGGGNSNTAAGAYAGVVAGQNNTACNQLSVIGGGNGNKIFQSGAPQNAEESFIGAGDTNDIGSYRSFIGAGQYGIVGDYDAFIGAGYSNLADKRYAFSGAGALNEAGGIASVVAGGGAEFYETQTGIGNQTLSYGNLAMGEDSFVGAGDLNHVTGNGSFIGAGDWTYALDDATTAGNQVSGSDSFIGTGDQNVVSANQAFIGAGNQNTVTANEGFIGSGSINAIASPATYATILGGNRNSAGGEYASILGGYGNTANGAYAIVAGGDGNAATGTLSFVGGYHAMAAHNGSFVWSDYTSGSTALKDAASNQFVVRASGGTTFYSNEGMTSGVTLAAGGGAWASLSDRNAKTTIVPVDGDAILARVAALPVSTWRYTSERGVRHVGPMAQDFYAAFGVGEDDRHITSIDEDGVALAAIEALDRQLHRENARLRTRVASLESKVSEIDALRRELRDLRETLIRFPR